MRIQLCRSEPRAIDRGRSELPPHGHSLFTCAASGADDILHFDSTGQLRGTSGPLTFTLSGFDLKKVHAQAEQIDPRRKPRRPRIRRQQAEKSAPSRLAMGDIIRTSRCTSRSMPIAIGDYGPPLDAIFVESIARPRSIAYLFIGRTYVREKLSSNRCGTFESTSSMKRLPAETQQAKPRAHRRWSYCSKSFATPQKPAFNAPCARAYEYQRHHLGQPPRRKRTAPSVTSPSSDR